MHTPPHIKSWEHAKLPLIIWWGIALCSSTSTWRWCLVERGCCLLMCYHQPGEGRKGRGKGGGEGLQAQSRGTSCKHVRDSDQNSAQFPITLHRVQSSCRDGSFFGGWKSQSFGWSRVGAVDPLRRSLPLLDFMRLSVDARRWDIRNGESVGRARWFRQIKRKRSDARPRPHTPRARWTSRTQNLEGNCTSRGKCERSSPTPYLSYVTDAVHPCALTRWHRDKQRDVRDQFACESKRNRGSEIGRQLFIFLY